MNKTKKAIVFGTNGQAEVVSYLLEKDSEYEVIAFCCSSQYRESDVLFNKPLVDFEDIEVKYPPTEYEMYVSLSYADQNKLRERFYYEAKAKGYTLLSYISSKTTNYAKSIGDNTFIFEDNTIQPFVSIGNNVVLWSGNHIGHHSSIQDNCFISSHVVISGHCTIGKNSFIGVNSTLRDGISIGSFNTLGAGCLMIKSSEKNQIYIGTKATKYIKK